MVGSVSDDAAGGGEERLGSWAGDGVRGGTGSSGWVFLPLRARGGLPLALSTAFAAVTQRRWFMLRDMVYVMV
jgi:hypothetical protein